MTEIYTDRDLKHTIETIITTSNTFLFIVSPYIDLSEERFTNIIPKHSFTDVFGKEIVQK